MKLKGELFGRRKEMGTKEVNGEVSVFKVNKINV